MRYNHSNNKTTGSKGKVDPIPGLTRRALIQGIASSSVLFGVGCTSKLSGFLKNGKSVRVESELATMDAFAQAELVRRGQISPLELVDAAIERVEKLDPVLGFMAGHDFDMARKKARSASSTGPFAGVPILLKDTLSYPGLRYSNGSRLFATNIAKQGSDYTDRLDNAGFIVLGKSTSPEFALLGMTESQLEGITRNPWNLDFSPAGSSGGSASAVAAGVVPIAHASDGGGSVRIPASACGLFGLKPSRGRNVSNHIAPTGLPLDLIEQHCVSRSVRDSALFLSVTEKRGRSAVLEPVGFVRDPINRPLRIAYYTKTLMGGDADPEVRQVVDKTAQLCRELGHRVEEVAPPDLDGEAISDAFFATVGFAMTRLDAMMTPILGHALDSTVLESFTLELVEWYKRQPSDTVARAVETLNIGSKTIHEYFQRYDVALTPTLALPPQRIGRFDGLSRQQAIEFTQKFAGYTPVHNQAGVPGMSVPLGWSSNGLPIGSHFATRIGGEALLFGLAYQLEAVQPWAHKWPPISAIK